MVSKRLILVAATALALLSLPGVARARPAGEGFSIVQIDPPCEVKEFGPCTQVALHLVAAPASAWTLSDAELRYHRETTEHMQHLWAMPRAASSVGPLSQAELDYYRATTAHMNQPAAAAGVTPMAHALTPAELHYHRDTVLHMHSR